MRAKKPLLVQTVTTIGLDIAKSIFQVHSVNLERKVIVRRQSKRRYVLTFSGSFRRA